MTEDSTLQLEPIAKRSDLFYPELKKNISRITPTALSLLGLRCPEQKSLSSFLQNNKGWQILKDSEIENVLVYVIDALGYHQFMKYSEIMKKKFPTNGIELSSVYPTITSTAMVSIHLGEMPIDHGIVGQRIRFEEIDNVVDTLTLRTKQLAVGDLEQYGINAKKWLWSKNPIPEDSNIDRIHLIESHITKSGLSHFINENVHTIGYSSHIDNFAAAKKILETPSVNRRFLVLYSAAVDSITHRYTTSSSVLKNEIQNIESLFFKMLKDLDPKVAEKTAIFITADHGQENLHQKNKITITHEEEDELADLLKTRGRSGRVMHLFSKEGKHEETVDWFDEKLGDKGIIITPKNYHKLMGKGADSQRVIERIGDIQIILGKNAAMFFGHSGEYDPNYHLGLNATHGSLSADELSVPLLLGRVDDLLSK
ncbi:MAG: alkaline phosphatase family protein [Candidatus Heimdallarchaeota archaeon]